MRSAGRGRRATMQVHIFSRTSRLRSLQPSCSLRRLHTNKDWNRQTPSSKSDHPFWRFDALTLLAAGGSTNVGFWIGSLAFAPQWSVHALKIGACVTLQVIDGRRLSRPTGGQGLCASRPSMAGLAASPSCSLPHACEIGSRAAKARESPAPRAACQVEIPQRPSSRAESTSPNFAADGVPEKHHRLPMSRLRSEVPRSDRSCPTQ